MKRSDRDLIRAAAQGDRTAFEILVAHHYRTVIQFTRRSLGNADGHTAEDLAQEVFLALWKSARSFRGEAKVMTWLIRTATNASLNHKRAARLRSAMWLGADGPAKDAGETKPPETAALVGERADRVRKAVASLPVNQRAAILLRHFEGMSYAEIAEILNTSLSAVESLLFRAKRSLHAQLAAEDPDLSASSGGNECLI